MLGSPAVGTAVEDGLHDGVTVDGLSAFGQYGWGNGAGDGRQSPFAPQKQIDGDKQEAMACEYAGLLSGQLASQARFFDDAIDEVETHAAESISLIYSKNRELLESIEVLERAVAEREKAVAALQAEVEVASADVTRGIADARKERASAEELLSKQQLLEKSLLTIEATAAATAAEAAETLTSLQLQVNLICFCH